MKVKLKDLRTQNYMKKLAKNISQRDRLRAFKGTRLCSDGLTVHVYKGLEGLAQAVGQAVKRTERCDSDYPIYLNFYYRGIEFYQLEKSSL